LATNALEKSDHSSPSVTWNMCLTGRGRYKNWSV